MPVVAISADVCPTFDGPCQDLVDTLRKLLQKAEAGELQSFMGAGFAANGDRVSMHGGIVGKMFGPCKGRCTNFYWNTTRVA